MNWDSQETFEIDSKTRSGILFLIIFPTILLVLGILFGLTQALHRAGIIQSTHFLGFEYYQGLTLHGVVNAIVFTTFFEVAFGYGVITYFLRKKTCGWAMVLSIALMFIGVLLAAGAMLAGKATVLYTFYPPLKAHPAFYLGAALIIVGSWVPLFDWSRLYLQWRREHPGQKTPLAVVGMLVTFIIWFACTLPVAYEVLVMLLPWSLGWVEGINIPLSRTLFWFFGHPLVYFWLLPSYVMFYVMLPKIAGGKLFSDAAGRMVFLLFLILSIPVGVHHQFADPGLSSSYKWIHGLLTFGVALPSLITAFTIAASLEFAARKRGGKGLLGWWKKLPYWDSERWLFPYFFLGLCLFAVGGITGIINASIAMNKIVHNTAWIPGHFHMTLGGPVFLSFIGMSLFLVTRLKGKPISHPKIVLAVPYFWFFGTFIFGVCMRVAGLLGQPRRTNLGLTYSNVQDSMFISSWQLWSYLSALGAVIMTLGMVLYFFVFFKEVFSRALNKQQISFPKAECYHDEHIPALLNFRPWIIAMVILILFSYIPPLIQVSKPSTGQLSPRYHHDSPVPE